VPDRRPEDAGVVVRLDRLVAALGGPEYRITYPNGDQAACVSVVFDAIVVGGRPTADGDETSDVGWFSPGELPSIDLNDLNRCLLDHVMPLLA
jgi:ADP-ribose pyrophosphatase YjhB (NUDIX family)